MTALLGVLLDAFLGELFAELLGDLLGKFLRRFLKRVLRASRDGELKPRRAVRSRRGGILRNTAIHAQSRDRKRIGRR
jgi:hypothetical protein